MDDQPRYEIDAGAVDELEENGHLVVQGSRCPILILRHDGRVFAVDNRCPHLGFPLHRGSVDDGILTCHWHHARFELSSGCTFDPWADDVTVFPVEERHGRLWVRDDGTGDDAERWHRRLDEAMAHNLELVLGKSVHGLLTAAEPPTEVVRRAMLFGMRHRDGWGVGATILTALANLLPGLPPETIYLALFHGARRVAADCAGAPPRHRRRPLERADAPMITLKRWFRRMVAVRHREGAERVLLTAIDTGTPASSLADMLLIAASDRVFADGGHALDFVNKAFESLDVIGWSHAADVLPTVVGDLASARGAEESQAWRQPVDLIALLGDVDAALPDAIAEGVTVQRPFRDHGALAEKLLVDDPRAVVEALLAALRRGARPTDLGRAVAHGAALRLARFGTVNEHGDWDAAHHTFTYCNAMDALLARADPVAGPESWEALRGLFHGALRLYLNRYLNVPPARLPGERGDTLDGLPVSDRELRAHLLEAFDRRQQVNQTARLVARYLRLDLPAEALIATLAYALLREDAGFHAYQSLEAGVRQFRAWGKAPEAEVPLIAAVRYLAAHAPTERSSFQTAAIARRLQRGARLHGDMAEDSQGSES